MRAPRFRTGTLVTVTLALAATACTDLVSSGDISGKVATTSTGGTSTGGTVGGTSTGGTGGSTGGTSTGGTGGAVTGGSGGLDTTNVDCGTALVVELSPMNGDPMNDDPSIPVRHHTRYGSTVGPSGTNSPEVGPECAAGDGPERVYLVHINKPGFWTARIDPVETTFDSILYVRKESACNVPDKSVVCEDRPGASGNGGEVTAVSLPMQNTYAVFVDGKAATDQGDYRIDFDFWDGRDCAAAADNPVTVDIAPGQQTITLVANFLPPGNGDIGNVQCDPDVGMGTLDIPYLFPAVDKLITVTPWPTSPDLQPTLASAAACMPVVPQDHCFTAASQGAPVSVQTTDPHVWVDSGGAAAGSTFKMTIQTSM